MKTIIRKKLVVAIGAALIITGCTTKKDQPEEGSSDTIPSVNFSTNKQLVSETSGKIKVTLKLSNKYSGKLYVPIEVTGTATKNSDYALEFKDGVSVSSNTIEKEVYITIMDDAKPEGGETIILKLKTTGEGTVGKDNIHTVVIAGQTQLNDTGMTHFSDKTRKTLTVEPVQFPNQDAAFGMDVDKPLKTDGEAGFSYTKIDRSGNILNDNATKWTCVRDNNTGITWESKSSPITDFKKTIKDGLIPSWKTYADKLTSPLKTPIAAAKAIEALTFMKEDASGNDESIIPKDASYDAKDVKTRMKVVLGRQWELGQYHYTWYSDNPKNNGGFAGTLNKFKSGYSPFHEDCTFRTKEDAGGAHTGCNTKAYVDEINKYGKCGFKDWRLPSITELHSIANMDSVHNRTPNTFKNTFMTKGGKGIYLSSTPAKDEGASVWSVDSYTGKIVLLNKQIRSGKIRAARNGE